MNGELEKLQEKLKNLIEEVRIKENEIFSIKSMKKAGLKLSRKDLKYLRDLEIQLKKDYYDIDQLQIQIEEIKSNSNSLMNEEDIAEEIDGIEDEAKEETDAEELTGESESYALSRDMILDNKLKIERTTSPVKDSDKDADKEKDSTYHLLGDNISESKCEIYDINGAREKIKNATQKAKQTEPKEIDGDSKIIDIELDDDQVQHEDYLSKDRKKRIAQDAVIAALLLGIGAVSIKLVDAIQDRQKNKANTIIEQPVVSDDTNAYDYESNTVVIPEPTPSNPFINIAGYNEAYLKDYDSTKEIYNTTAEDAVEYVNDAYKILETRFYGEEATLDDIINVIVAIRTGNLYTEDNVSILRPIDSVLNLITENYIFGVPTEEDITKLSALQYFAKEGTDLDKFLTRYYQLLVDVLRNPYDGLYKDNLYNFLNVYASNLNNGFVNEPELTTGNEEIDNDAKLNSYYDFQVSYDGFVFDTLPLLQSGVNDPNAGSQEDIDRSNRSLELKDLLYTAVHDLVQDCEPSLTRGGE